MDSPVKLTSILVALMLVVAPSHAMSSDPKDIATLKSCHEYTIPHEHSHIARKRPIQHITCLRDSLELKDGMSNEVVVLLDHSATPGSSPPPVNTSPAARRNLPSSISARSSDPEKDVSAGLNQTTAVHPAPESVSGTNFTKSFPHSLERRKHRPKPPMPDVYKFSDNSQQYQGSCSRVEHGFERQREREGDDYHELCKKMPANTEIIRTSELPDISKGKCICDIWSVGSARMQVCSCDTCAPLFVHDMNKYCSILKKQCLGGENNAYTVGSVFFPNTKAMMGVFTDNHVDDKNLPLVKNCGGGS